MKMKITILEDQPVETQRLKTELNLWNQKNDFSIEITEYSSGEEFFRQNLAKAVQKTNVFFLDIQLKGINGIDVARYEVHALNYLLKPVHSESLFLCFDEIAKYLAGSSYLYRSRQEIVSIPYRDILSFSSSLTLCRYFYHIGNILPIFHAEQHYRASPQRIYQDTPVIYCQYGTHLQDNRKPHRSLQ